MLCVLLDISRWGFPKLWGSGVPISYIEHYEPRICRLFLHSLLIEPAPPSLTAAQCLSDGGSPLLPRRPRYWRVSPQDHPPTCASSVSVPAYQKTLARLPLTCHFQSSIPPPRSRPRHTCQIPVAAAPMLTPKYLFTWPSDVVQLLPASTRSLRATCVFLILCAYLVNRM